ncbi:MAG: glycoside hydrolase family 31 protein, partial [Myxococcales bacterium]|nr:glycoside hydrolase family 31 protein [Myxococcales bacterium]
MSHRRPLTLSLALTLVPTALGCHEDDPGRPDILVAQVDTADLDTTDLDTADLDTTDLDMGVLDTAGPDASDTDITAPDTTSLPMTLLSAGSATLELSPGGETLTLLRDGTRQLTLNASDLSVGTVPALDAIANYDPTYFEPGVELAALYSPPEGLAWASATLFTPAPTARPGESVDIGLDFDGRAATLTVEVKGPGRIACKLSVSEGAPVAFVRLGVRGDASEGWYGMGEVLDSPDHRGKIRPLQILLSEKLDSGYNEVHVPVPLAIGTTGWGLFVESYRPGVFAFGTHAPDLVRATFGLGGAWQEGLTFHLYSADHALDITRHYYETTGFPKLPAPWALGPWLWRDEVAGEAQVRDDLDTIRELDLAASGYWIDRPYASAVNSFDFDPDKYDDPAAMIARAHALGMRMAVWHTPYLDPDDDATAAEHLDAKSKGYFPPVIGAQTPDWGATLDFTNPDAVAYWRGRLAAYTDLGIEGYKLDYGEEVLMGAFGIRSPWTFADGADELTMHRRAQILYHEVYAATLPPDGGFMLVRAGGYGDQIHGPIVWPGDIDASLTLHGETVTTPGGDTYGSVGGLPAAVVAGSSLGPSGYAFFAADTGGYRNSPPSKETFLRWMAQSALTPVMQVGTNSNDLPWEFGKDRENDPVLVAQYRKFARLHLRLFPALWTWAKELATTGRAIQKPLGLATDLRDVTPLTDGAPIDAHPDFVYLLGDELLVAPAVRPGVTTVTAPLPAGTWTDLLTGAVYPGGKET